MHCSFTHVSQHKKQSTLVLAAMLMLLAITNKAIAQSLPMPSHIVILIEENQANSIVIGNPGYAPYINQIANDSNATVFTQVYALTHPSVGFQGVNSTIGSYVRKHNPVANWQGTNTNQVPDSLNQPFTAFPTDFSKLPTVSYVVPNEDSDMHNGFPNVAVPAGDRWFKNNLKNFIDWVSDPHNNTLFIYTFDEDDGIANNNIPTLFYGPMVKTGTNQTNYNLYSILRTIEDMYGLGYAGAAQSTVPITGCWQDNPAAGLNAVSANLIRCYPNPATSQLQFQGDALNMADTEIEITDVTGRHIENIHSNSSARLSVNTSAYQSGMYYYNLLSTGHTLQSGKFIVAHQ